MRARTSCSHFDFPGGSDGKASVYNAGHLGSIPGLERFPGEGNGNPLQYSCLENPMDGGDWCRLLPMGLQRVGHDWATWLSLSLEGAARLKPRSPDSGAFSCYHVDYSGFSHETHALCNHGKVTSQISTSYFLLCEIQEWRKISRFLASFNILWFRKT